MPTVNFGFTVPDHLDDPLIDHLPDPDIRVADARDIWVNQILTPSAKRRRVGGPDGPSNECGATELLQLSSADRTVDGRWELDLDSAICGASRRYGEPSITASPVMGPTVLTSVGYALSADGRNLRLRVFTLSPDNEPVDAHFHWHAVVPLLLGPF